jgi:elongation factor P
MSIGINEVTGGLGLRVDGNVYVVTDYSHVKPGKGSAFVRVKMKNLKTGLSIERTFKSSERLEDVFLEEKFFQYLYKMGTDLYFMDQTSYEEAIVPESLLGADLKFLQDNLVVKGFVLDGQIQKVELPNFIVAQVLSSDPGIKGDSSRAGTKPARIDSGADVQVPLFIAVEDWIKVDTRTGTYVERVKK